MPKPSPRYSEEPTTDLVVGMVVDARDLALVHLNRLQRELSSELGNLGELIKARAVSVAGFLVAVILAAQALAFGLAAAFELPVWVGFAAISVVVAVATVIFHKRTSKPSKDIDLMPDSALADVKQDVNKLVDSASNLTS
jgi:Putative Actinobacterial Holin-X, holin superfamily III